MGLARFTALAAFCVGPVVEQASVGDYGACQHQADERQL